MEDALAEGRSSEWEGAVARHWTLRRGEPSAEGADELAFDEDVVDLLDGREGDGEGLAHEGWREDGLRAVPVDSGEADQAIFGAATGDLRPSGGKPSAVVKVGGGPVGVVAGLGARVPRVLVA